MDSIIFNKCQTPMEELSVMVDGKKVMFQDTPAEVQEQFWDFLNNVPFIRWLVSPDRPMISELPRDEYGKTIIDITRPPILEGSDYFRQAALTWQNNKHRYTNLKPNANPNSEFGKYIREERRRGWEGLANPDTGMWVTGDHYWLMNYCPIHMVVKREDGLEMRSTRHSKFWDGQFLMSHYVLSARAHKHHAAYLASRGKGKTSFGAATLAKRFIIGESAENRESVQCMVTAADRTKLIGTNQILDVFIDNIDFCAKNTQFASRRLKSSKQELEWEMGYKKSGSDVAYGSQNSVSGIISGVNQDKLNGSRGVLYLVEEAGIFKDLLSMYNMIRPSVEQGSSVFGEVLMYGTAGDDMSDFTAFQEIFYSPEGYNMEPLDNVFDKEGQGRKKCCMFYPAYLNYDDSCVDENGNSDVTKALLMLLMDRYKVKYGSTDVNTITKRISQYPITPQEAIIRSRGNMFPVTDLNARLNEIDNNPDEYNDVYVGELVQKDGKVEFVPTGDIPIRDFPTKDNKVRGAVEIFSMPQKTPDGTIPRGRYIAGADPYDNDVAESMSLGSFLMLDTWTDTIVMEYTGRPDYAEDFYEICRKACLFYNAVLLYEQNKKGLFPYFSQKNSLHLLADTPEYLLDKQLIKGIGYGNTRKGVTTTLPIKEYGFGLIRDWLLKPVTKVIRNEEGEEEEVTFSNLYNIRNRALLKELILYHPQINVDRIMALCMLMIYRQEKMVLLQGDLKKGRESPTGLEADTYWDKNYPGKKGKWQ